MLKKLLEALLKRASNLISATSSSVSFVPVSGENVIAPFDGWCIVSGRNNNADDVCYISLGHDEIFQGYEVWAPKTKLAVASIFIPVRKGQSLNFVYSSTFSIENCKWIRSVASS